MEEYFEKIIYHIEVEHAPGEFDDDMDLMISDPAKAYEAFQHLKEKYSDRKIKITKIKETKTYEPISEQNLLEDKIKAEEAYLG